MWKSYTDSDVLFNYIELIVTKIRINRAQDAVPRPAPRRALPRAVRRRDIGDNFSLAQLLPFSVSLFSNYCFYYCFDLFNDTLLLFKIPVLFCGTVI